MFFQRELGKIQSDPQPTRRFLVEWNGVGGNLHRRGGSRLCLSVVKGDPIVRRLVNGRCRGSELRRHRLAIPPPPDVVHNGQPSDAGNRPLHLVEDARQVRDEEDRSRWGFLGNAGTHWVCCHSSPSRTSFTWRSDVKLPVHLMRSVSISSASMPHPKCAMLTPLKADLTSMKKPPATFFPPPHIFWVWFIRKNTANV